MTSPRLAAIVAVLAWVTPASAHEIGTTRVTATLQPEGSYRIEVVTDALALDEKLSALSDQPEPLAMDGLTDSRSKSASALQARLRAADELFRRRVNVAFDDVAV